MDSQAYINDSAGSSPDTIRPPVKITNGEWNEARDERNGGGSSSCLHNERVRIRQIWPLRRVWAGYDGARIYVQFDDGYSDAVMNLADVASDEQIVNRSLAMLVAAVTAGRPVTLRYISGQDGSSGNLHADCSAEDDRGLAELRGWPARSCSRPGYRSTRNWKRRSGQ